MSWFRAVDERESLVRLYSPDILLLKKLKMRADVREGKQ